eukprot:18437-Heterococcus_DN1.PRE.1
MAILVADCFTSPLLRLINPAGLFKRYVLLKRARTQAAANALMEGTIWNIGKQHVHVVCICNISVSLAIVNSTCRSTPEVYDYKKPCFTCECFKLSLLLNAKA